MQKPIVMCVVGARPNFVKIGPILDAMDAQARLASLLVHTGQHYDAAMNAQFFEDLRIRAPDLNLGVGSGSHARQTAEVMIRFEEALDAHKPDAVLVVGDVNSTLAAALVASKKGVPIIHVEAGLRSFDRSMPEEINRILTDQISDVLFVTEESAVVNLLREGISRSKIHFVGNVMIDALRVNLDRAVPAADTLAAAGVQKLPQFSVATLHRPANVDDQATLARLLDVFAEIGRDFPVVFPVHPRTRQRIDQWGLSGRLSSTAVIPIAPVSYLAMLGLLSGASLVLTDSGGVQEETTVLGVPCFTLRENTERPVTIEQGTSILVGSSPDRIRAAYDRLREDGRPPARTPALWDGQAAQRIATVLAAWLQKTV